MPGLETEIDFGISFRLSLQRALVFEIGNNVRYIAVDWDWERRHAWVRYVFAEPPSSEDEESAECALSEVIADFPEVPGELKIENDFIVYDGPRPFRISGKWTVFARREC